MLDPSTALGDLERLAGLPCDEWQAMADGGGVDCEDLAEAQTALRAAIAAGGTHYDVLGRFGRGPDQAPERVRLAVRALADSARALGRQRLQMAVRAMAGA